MLVDHPTDVSNIVINIKLANDVNDIGMFSYTYSSY